MTLRVVELFAGIGAQRMALTLAGIPHEVVAVSEIDAHAVDAYSAIFGGCPNLGDIRLIERLPPCDLVTYSFPCQDVSIAGRRAGMAEGGGTRSGLVWEVVRLLEAAGERERERPEWLLMENVPRVLDAPEWPALVGRLAALGYRSKWAVLDSSLFGSAQQRRRAFMLSRLGADPPDLPTGTGEPPRTIADVMEPTRDERYIQRVPLDMVRWRERPSSESPIRVFGCEGDDGVLDTGIRPSRSFHDRRVYCADGLAPALVVKDDCRIRVVCDIRREGWHEQCNRIYCADGLAPTICARGGGGREVRVAS